MTAPHGNRLPIRIKLRETSGGHEVEVGGVRIENAVRQLDLSAGVYGTPTLTLTLATAERVVEVEGEAHVQVLMSEATRKALVHLGWTAPRDEAAPEVSGG